MKGLSSYNGSFQRSRRCTNKSDDWIWSVSHFFFQDPLTLIQIERIWFQNKTEKCGKTTCLYNNNTFFFLFFFFCFFVFSFSFCFFFFSFSFFSFSFFFFVFYLCIKLFYFDLRVSVLMMAPVIVWGFLTRRGPRNFYHVVKSHQSNNITPDFPPTVSLLVVCGCINSTRLQLLLLSAPSAGRRPKHTHSI